MRPLVDVAALEVLGAYRRRLAVADGTVGDADFTGRGWRGVFVKPRTRGLVASRGRTEMG